MKHMHISKVAAPKGLKDAPAVIFLFFFRHHSDVQLPTGDAGRALLRRPADPRLRPADSVQRGQERQDGRVTQADVSSITELCLGFHFVLFLSRVISF